MRRPSDSVEDYLATEASEAKKQLADAEATKKTAETALRDAQKILDNAPGRTAPTASSRWCFSVKVSQYTYEVCLRSSETGPHFSGKLPGMARGQRKSVVLRRRPRRVLALWFFWARGSAPETCSSLSRLVVNICFYGSLF